MALDFPSNPINGQTYDNYYWDASSSAWRSSGTKAGLQARTTALELANATTNKSGLVPIVPSSVTVSSGSAVIDSNGLITLSSAYNITVNNVFSSAYKNYVIYVNYNTTNSTPSVFLRMSSGGTPLTTNYVTGSIRETSSGSTVHMGSPGTASGVYIFETDVNQFSGFGTSTIEVLNPFLTQYTVIKAHGEGGYAAQGWNMILSSGIHDAVSRDGFNLSHGTTAATGTVQVYGVRNS